MEGFGLVMVEAMGCGCAVVASNLPAVADIIIDNETGLLVEQKNPSDIVNKVSFMFDNSEILKKLSLQGRKYVEDRFDWSVAEKKYSDLFNSIIKYNDALKTK
jgi:glycosyltransferase involved in cell wall biosynthesis